MRGGFLHCRAMADGLKGALEGLGAPVRTEHPVGPGRRAGAVDLYAELREIRLVCEVELGPRRALKDVQKAEILGADVLLIVTPTASVARSVRARLRTLAAPRVRVHVLPYGLALKYLSQVFGGECGRDGKTETLPRPRGSAR